jgi:hypothetical protein
MILSMWVRPAKRFFSCDLLRSTELAPCDERLDRLNLRSTRGFLLPGEVEPFLEVHSGESPLAYKLGGMSA